MPITQSFPSPTQYATAAQLTAYLSSSAAPIAGPEADRLLMRASEVLDEVTRDQARLAWHGLLFQIRYSGYVDPWAIPPHSTGDYKAALSAATCAQVEFWLEVGEEHYIGGLESGPQATIAGKLQISKLPLRLAVRARRALNSVDLLTAQVYAR